MFNGIDKFKEECGVFGIFSNNFRDVASLVYYGLFALQHRGQESAGMVIYDGKDFYVKKDVGLVGEVFDENFLNIKGFSAIGHVRYSTTGGNKKENAQPLFNKIAVAHNGNLVNADVLRKFLKDEGFVFQTAIDTEVILNLIIRYLKDGIEKAIFNAVKKIKGSYSILILTEDKLIGIRDPNGIRPLCVGKIDKGFILSSESCALSAIGAEFIRDVEPGEMVVIDKDGLKSIKLFKETQLKTCAFEYIYFARPDSIIDGVSVYESRVKAGIQLYKEAPIDADVVVGVPDSGTFAAVGYAQASNIPYGIGFVKNKYIGRTFIEPKSDSRDKLVLIKLNPLKGNIFDKKVVLVDDSIVRGTTMKRLVNLLKRAGAKEVHVRIASPVVAYPCYFGIDTPYRKELIGATMTLDQIKDNIGADSLAFLSIDGLLKSLNREGFCFGCFNGLYPVCAPLNIDKFQFERENKNEI